MRAAPRTVRAVPWSPSHQLGRPHLILPGDGHTARRKLLVEVLVSGLQFHTLNRGELFDVQDILAVNGLGLGGQRQRLERNTTGTWENSSVLRVAPALAWLCPAPCSSMVWSQKLVPRVLPKHGSPFSLKPSVPSVNWGSFSLTDQLVVANLLQPASQPPVPGRTTNRHPLHLHTAAGCVARRCVQAGSQ